MGKSNLFRTLDVSRLNHSTLSLLSVLLIASIALSGFVWVGSGDSDNSLSGFAPASVNLKIGKFNQPFYSSLSPKVAKKPVYTDIGEKAGEPFFRTYWDVYSSAPKGHSAPSLQGYLIPAKNNFVDKYSSIKKEFSAYIKPLYRVADYKRVKQNADYTYQNVAGKVYKTLIGYVGTDALKKLDAKNQLVELTMSDEQFKKETKEGRTPSRTLGWVAKTKDLELVVPTGSVVPLPVKPTPSAKKIIANFMFDQAVYSSLAPVVPKRPLYTSLGETANNPFFRLFLDTSIIPPSGHTAFTFKIGYVIPAENTYVDRNHIVKKEFSKYLQPLYRVKGATNRGGKETDYFYQTNPGKVDKTLIGFVGTDELAKYDTERKLVRINKPADQLRKEAVDGKKESSSLGWISTTKGGFDAVEDEIVPVPPEPPVVPTVVPLPVTPKPPTPVPIPASNSEIMISINGVEFDGLKQGDKKIYTVEGKEYEVEVLQISDKEQFAQLRINGEMLPKMKVGQTDILSDGSRVKLISIHPPGKPPVIFSPLPTKTPTPTLAPTKTPSPTPIPSPTKTPSPTPSPEPEIVISIGDAVVANQK